MDKPVRRRVAVLYGGRSAEHEISLQSAKCVIDNLDPERFEVLPIAIDPHGEWHVQDLARLRASDDKALPVDRDTPGVALATRPSESPLVGYQGPPIDVVFPVMHGPLCEDGSVQGLFELADVAYVGAGVLASAVCMDKDVAKRLVRADGIETVDYLALREPDYRANPTGARTAALARLGLPLFVKPATLGSSIGITRVARSEDLEQAVEHAFEYDRKLLLEAAIDAREIELAVLQSLSPAAAPEVSQPGEISAREAFYSFDRKYIEDDGAELIVPAALSAEQCAQAREIARRAFLLLECEGMARVDLFLDKARDRLLFNEANTIPGFTRISMYPKLWEASGLSYPDLLARLIELAVQRQERKQRLRRAR
jgi:D-alanine-D-alanine ligase